ncbi:hypothetical protein ACOJIV_14970 [Haloarcula sp. AONF1]
MNLPSVPKISRKSVPRDVAIACVGIIATVLLAPLVLFTTEIFVLIVPLCGGVAGLTYLAGWRRTAESHTHTTAFVGKNAVRVGETVVIIGIGSLALLGALQNGRTIQFHLLSSVIGSAIIVQIGFAKTSALRPRVVLAELLGLLLVIQYTALLTTPGFIGVDTWVHVTQFIADIQSAGTTAAISESKYSVAPVYHILVVSGAALFGSSLRTAMFASAALVIPITPLLVYSTARYMLAVRGSLLAAALFTMSDYMLRWSIDVIPNSLGLVYFAAVLFGLTKLFYTDTRRPLYGLTLYCCLSVVLVHQVSTFIVLTLLGAGVVAKLVADYTDYLSGVADRVPAEIPTVNTIGLFGTTTVLAMGFWSVTPYGDQSFIGRMIVLLSSDLSGAGFLNLRSSNAASGELPTAIVQEVPTAVTLVDAMGFSILLCLLVLGLLVLLQRHRLTQLSAIFVVGAGIMLVFTLGLPLFGVNVFIPDRWFAFLYILMAIVGVFGLRYVTRRFGTRTVVGCMLLLALVFPGSVFVSRKATLENPAFEEAYPRYSHTESELAAVESISALRPKDRSTVVTDHPYRMLFPLWQNQSSRPLAYDSDSGGFASRDRVYRRYQSTGSPIITANSQFRKVQLERELVCPSDSAVVYTNGAVQYCRMFGESG